MIPRLVEDGSVLITVTTEILHGCMDTRFESLKCQPLNQMAQQTLVSRGSGGCPKETRDTTVSVTDLVSKCCF